ncbi:MAG: TolB family protein [Vicinamibacterales bacterium]
MSRTLVPALAAGLVAAVVASSGLVAQAGRPMTIDDLLGAVRVADPQLSPDGRTVAYIRTTTDLTPGRRNADIWAVSADGGSPRALIAGDKSENTPRWSPDGRTIAFISTRGGAPQVYVAGADGSNVEKVTDLAMGVQPPLVFSPDGTKVAFVSDVHPECADEACNRRMKDAADTNPVKVHRLTRLLYRHWDAWRENVRHHVLVANVDGRREPPTSPAV